MCRMRSGESYKTAVCRSHQLVQVGIVSCSSWNALTLALRRGQKRGGQQHSAASNKQGQQKSPAVIEALLIQAMHPVPGGEEEPMQLQGSFTDVGPHTGCDPKGTCWPLVRSLVQVRAALWIPPS